MPSKPTYMPATPPERPSRHRLGRALIAGLASGAALFALGQGVVLDRGGDDFAAAASALGLLFVVAVPASLFVQAARRDWRLAGNGSAPKDAASEPPAQAPPQRQPTPYGFTGGLALAGLLVLGLTLGGVRLVPRMLPAAEPAPMDEAGPVDLPLYERQDAPPPTRHPFDRRD